MQDNALDKLEMEIKGKKNVLIQGVPSSIEKHLAKFSYVRNLTPRLKTRKLDFALVFAVSENQLKSILSEIIPALKEDTKIWVAHPKVTSKISTDLNREGSWSRLYDLGYELVETIPMDHVWQAISFVKSDTLEDDLEMDVQNVSLGEEDEKFLMLEVDFPEDISDERAREIVSRIALLLDSRHRELGGHGLTIKDIKITDHFHSLAIAI